MHQSWRLALIILVLLTSLWQQPVAMLAAPTQAGQQLFITTNNTGISQLSNDAPPAPAAYGDFGQFGMLTSPSITLPFGTNTLQINYQATLPKGSAIFVDLRISSDGSHWSAWATELMNGAAVHFDRWGQVAQYRFILLANQHSPTVTKIEVEAVAQPAPFMAMEDQPAVAPTFKIHATREGLVGHRTANGHRITKSDRFVSLPCACVLSSNGGHEYQVRLTYQGRSVVLPVYDVGPWNRKDNYWAPADQRTFGDLRQGWPQDHAAFFDGYNKGRSGLGWKVRFPTAVDVGDGAWIDDLQIKGDQAVLEITFLWMGSDPEAQP